LTLWAEALLARDSSPWWIRLEAWNRLFWVLLIVAAVAGAVQLTRPLPADSLGGLASDGVASSGPGSEAIPSTRTDTISFDPARLFRAAPRRAGRSAPRSNVTLSELSRQLTLQGILGGTPPQAIILNHRTDQTVYVPPGDYVGEIKVEEVRRSSVVLSWKNETLELVL
jgi:hypothetical protein